MKKILLLAILSIFILSCASLPTKSKSSFEYYELANGIPLILNKNDSNQIVSLQISVKGGTSLLSSEYSGLEGSLFQMMTLGSKNFPYEEIQKTLYKTQGSIYASSNQLGSILGLVSIDYYFEELLSIFLDGFLNPSFESQEYTTLMTSISQSLQYRREDPNTLLTESITEERYKNHPYETSSNVTVDSLSNITIENMKAHLDEVHDASKIAIIAVGNFNGSDLVRKLNTTLGLIESEENIYPIIPPATIGGETKLIELESAQGSGYVAYTVPGPNPGTKDEIAVRIAADIFSEILFNLVREHYGATYSIGSSYTYSKAPYITTRAFKVSDLEHISSYINEAEKLMYSNNLISGKDDRTGEFIYDTIEDRLEGYKNTLINSQFYSSQTNASISNQIVSSLLMFENAETYLNFTERVRSVDSQDVKDAFSTYWIGGEKQWFVVTGIGEKQRFFVN